MGKVDNNELEISLRNTNFPNELTTDLNVTYNLLEKIYYLPRRNTWNLWRPNWIGIINSVKFRDKMYKRLRLTNSDSPIYEIREKKLKKIQLHPPNTAKNYYESNFNKYISDIKQTWTNINELLNKCSNKKDFPLYFIINGAKLTTKRILQTTNSILSFKILVQPSLQTFLNTKTKL